MNLWLVQADRIVKDLAAAHALLPASVRPAVEAAVRGVVSAFALSLVTWAVYRGSWSGSDGDMVGLAVVAFFTDFTVDALIQAVTAVKKPVPA